MKFSFFSKCLWLLLVLCLVSPAPAKAFSVFAHEAVIDACWGRSIVPLLKQKFPGITDEELKEAHSYAYGGSLVADMGYFPFGKVYFTNLVHYVRSGDFVNALLAESRNADEYAFALGALSHYLTDKYGHSIATNHLVPIMYPELKEKFGSVVTYEEDHISHSRVEFSFDVLQTARGNYDSQAYHDFIGFNVAKGVLERAFLKTYGQDINDIFGNVDLAISTFRWSVKNLLPGLTKTAWALKKADILKTNPTLTARKFHFRMKKRDYYHEFGRSRERPGFKAEVLSFLLRIVPKVGPFRALKFKDPGTAGENLFIHSFDTVLIIYTQDLTALRENKIKLADIDFDTGNPTLLGEYQLADETYNETVLRLQDKKFNNLSAALKQNILHFFKGADSTRLKGDEHINWSKTHQALLQIKAAAPVPLDSLKMSKGG